MADTIRLNKVLRELNISIDRVADFLESNGHTIEKRPTTKISKDLYSLLCDEFQIDADKKIASKEVVEAKNKEKEEIREKHERQQEDSIKPQSEIIKASSKVVQFKKLGKIDWKEYYAMVTFNSNTLVESFANGVPVFCNSSTCSATPIAETDFTKIETPVYGDRVGLFSSLAYNNYSMEEMANGTAWELLNNLV